MTPALVMRAMYPNSTRTRGIDGQEQMLQLGEETRSPAERRPFPGASRSQIAKTRYQDDPGDKLRDNGGRQAPRP